jgi:ribose-phosphate pyrophosphokinase
MNLVGSVVDSDCIIVDDMIDTAGTLCKAADELKTFGANRIFAFATHGLFNGPAGERIEACALEEVVVANTVRKTKMTTSSSSSSSNFNNEEHTPSLFILNQRQSQLQ